MRRLAIVFALALAGCGGGSHKPASTPAPRPSATATTRAAGGNCAQLQHAAAQVAQALTGAAGKSSDQAKQQLDKLVGAAPREIRGDLQTIDDAYSQIVAAVKSSGGGTDLQKLQSVLAKLDQAKLTAASDHITSWIKTHC
jgi:uncharacterized membrane protein YdfJ with MMPL/SSD domain